MTVKKGVSGAKLRSLRRSRGLTQQQVASALRVSASYLNLIENNRRNLSLPLLLRLARFFQIKMSDLREIDAHPLLASLLTCLQERDQPINEEELIGFVQQYPAIARQWLATMTPPPSQTSSNEPTSGLFAKPPLNHAVGAYLGLHHNFFPDLERAAQRIRSSFHLGQGHLSYLQLCQTLTKRLSVQVRSEATTVIRAYDPHQRVITLADRLPASTQRFQVGWILCHLSEAAILDTLVNESPLGEEEPEQRLLLRHSLVNYLTAALLMPYPTILADALDTGYDLERLCAAYEVSFEQLCHRLGSLNDPASSGLALHFLKVNPAGMILKSFSRSGFNLPDQSHGCSRLHLYRSFQQPGILTSQHVVTDERESYLHLACAVRSGLAGHRSPKTYNAILIGCRAEDGEKTVYRDALRNAPTAVGASCHSCRINNCLQRSAPHISRRFYLPPTTRHLSPYAQLGR